MTLKTRFILLIVMLCAGLGLGLVALTAYERSESAKILSDVSRQRGALLDRLITLAGNSLKQFSLDYSLWTETVDFVNRAEPDRQWAEINIDASLANFNAQAVWVLKPDGRLFYATGGDPMPGLPPREDLIPLFRHKQFVHFFFEAADGIYEVRGAPIVPSDDITRSSPPQGYLLTGRRWDEAQLQTLSKLTDSNVDLIEPFEGARSGADGPDIHIYRPLQDWRGATIRLIDVRYQSPELERAAATDRWEATIFFVYGTLAIIIVVFFVQYWVLRPLTHISQSLAGGDTAPLNNLLTEKSELGRVANLVRSSFSDRERLHEALEERARLGRDLHDGVIQTLYASGMSLISIRAILRLDPSSAENLIDQTRAELNATIRDVRNFITRLEPEPKQPNNFSRAINSLLSFMQAGREVACTVKVDDDLAEQLPVDFRAQLLQILREAVSNAFRHGACEHLQVSLQAQGDGIRLEIADDGCGFDPAASRDRGRGLGNFRERAEALQGTLDIISQPGQGTCIRFLFPIPTQS